MFWEEASLQIRLQCEVTYPPYMYGDILFIRIQVVIKASTMAPLPPIPIFFENVLANIVYTDILPYPQEL